MLFADLNLARRLELADAAKHIDYAEARAKLLGTGCCAWERIGGGYAIFAGLDNPYSRVVGLGLDGPVSEAEPSSSARRSTGGAAPSPRSACARWPIRRCLSI